MLRNMRTTREAAKREINLSAEEPSVAVKPQGEDVGDKVAAAAVAK